MQFLQILQAAQAANYGMNSDSIGTPPSNQSLQVKTVIPIRTCSAVESCAHGDPKTDNTVRCWFETAAL